MAVQDEIREIQGRISLAQNKKTRAEVELDNAQANLTKSVAALKDEFGVTTNDEIKALHARLTSERDAALEAVKIELANAGV